MVHILLTRHRKAPPEVVASWPTPNLINPETRGPALMYLSIFLAALGLVVVSARIYSRIFITKAPGIDDILITLGWVAGVVLTVLVVIANRRFHSGRHVWDVDFRLAADHRLNAWISQWFYLWSTGVVKISVLLFYRRLSVSFSKAFLWATWIGIIYNIIQLVAFSLALLLVCLPIEAYWKSFDLKWALQHQDQYKCQNEGIGLTASAVFSVIGDFYAALLPSLLVARLKLPQRQKWAVAGLFSIGYLVVGMGIARAVLLHRMTLVTYDFTWELWEVWIWSLLELWLGLYAASAPALKPFFKRFLILPISSAVGTVRSGSIMRRNHTIGSGPAPKRPVRSWNCLSGSDGMPEEKEIPGSSISESVILKSSGSNPFLREIENQDLERGDSPVNVNAWKGSHKPSIDGRMAGDDAAYEAHCWSPESSPGPFAVPPVSHINTSQQEKHSTQYMTQGTQTMPRTSSTLSQRTYSNRKQTPSRHISTQFRNPEIIHTNATPLSTPVGRPLSPPPNRPLPQQPLRPARSGASLPEYEVQRDSLAPEPLRRNLTVSDRLVGGNVSEHSWLTTPRRVGMFAVPSRTLSWSVLDEADEEEQQRARAKGWRGGEI